jgi:hypothetical protein
MEISSANKYLLLILSTDKQWHLNAILNPGLVVFKAGPAHSYNKYHSRSFQQIEFSILKNFVTNFSVPEKGTSKLKL